MKTKKNKKRLSLTKMSIAILDKNKFSEVKGAEYQVPSICPTAKIPFCIDVNVCTYSEQFTVFEDECLTCYSA